ncbi:N-acetylglucosaminyldiphosphodolichol_N-acetylglucosaminyltransferase [Hexamita inflata]|uniref:UDP-N-acetylglucosamine transferase subunit ALG13 n=1 Tax=Hexamita inflata TaxID=28002 RepID=A0AA86NQM9_9EUKA|nr:N-acetylglucosaminyldiphosphodolichol N-acetylglucosaminyltransferase [Hexamita inflata]CAI9923498.1 N-acetylglucosaminyldiphosphodolichol N-acetylglucosaminyltransferase [Hexamita inflata]
MKIFVSVGTTEFKPLTDSLTSGTSAEFLKEHQIIVQYGTAEPIQYGKNTEVFAFTREISKYIENADLVISHAAAGTRLDVIAKLKPHLMVCNDTLAGNHQMEMVNANLQNKSCRVFENTAAFEKYLETVNLQSECIEMVKNVTCDAKDAAIFTQMIDDLRRKKTSNGTTKIIAVVGLLIFITSKLAQITK